MEQDKEQRDIWGKLQKEKGRIKQNKLGGSHSEETEVDTGFGQGN